MSCFHSLLLHVSRALRLSFKVHSKWAPPPGPPTGPHMKRGVCFQNLLLHVSRALRLSFKVHSKWAPPPGPPTGPLWREMSVSRTFCYMSLEPSVCLSKFTLNETLLRVPQRGPYEERCLFAEPSFTYPSGSPVKGSQYFVEVGFIILTLLITHCSPAACNWYLVPNTVSRTLFGPNIVFRNLFGPISFSENCSSYCSLQKPVRSNIVLRELFILL